MAIKKKLAANLQRSEIRRILLIDEIEDSALLAALVRAGYDVLYCDSVQKAWSFVYPHRPHLIILHLYNPNGQCFADLQECRALAEGVPILLATSGHVNGALTKALQHGAVSVLPDWLTPEGIRDAIHGLESATTRPFRAHSWSNLMEE
jgi:DNA-binding response OmpR family regulator